MDIEEWELLPEEGFLEIHGGDDDGGKKIHPKGNTVFHMNYFICPSNIVESIPNNQLPPLSIHVLEQRIPDKPPDHEPVEIIKKITPPAPDPVSHVFFKKMKETEFVDIKVDSPRSGNANRGFIPPIEGAAVFGYEEKGAQNAEVEIKEEDIEESNKGGSNIWKWSLTGIGAICSLGVTVCCIIVFRGSYRMSATHPQQNQKFHSQTHANERIKQGVNRASRLNEAVRAMRGAPIAKARITFGGHYDAPV
ncbi:hypothetical protein F511_12182 [Dorcoceras hygrometricum]|uniref:DUF6821 domain-containing protein n=1 Tax=Dorcoceras hygrometricum TaxID=472368 RepID=A0A2Z7C0D2_9LAMI|nr:hypothetical protein F511_12182 [Dorcoceras hygrometricum]